MEKEESSQVARLRKNKKLVSEPTDEQIIEAVFKHLFTRQQSAKKPAFTACHAAQSQ